jgi:AcrR family transcriptional regulator
MPHATRVRPPKQARSQRTLERLLAAAEQRLADRPWSEIGVAELCVDADTSVGAFYARFADKDALLDLLAERYRADMARFAEQLAAAVRAAPQRDREQALRNFVRSLVKAHRTRRALLRALALRAMLAPADAPQPFPQLAVGELAEQVRFPGIDSRSATLFVEAAVALLRGRVVFPELWEASPLEDDDELVARVMALGRALLGS